MNLIFCLLAGWLADNVRDPKCTMNTDEQRYNFFLLAAPASLHL